MKEQKEKEEDKRECVLERVNRIIRENRGEKKENVHWRGTTEWEEKKSEFVLERGNRMGREKKRECLFERGNKMGKENEEEKKRMKISCVRQRE